MSELLPNSFARIQRDVVFINGRPHAPIYCLSCGVHGGHVLEDSIDPSTGWCGYCCDDCAPKYGDDLHIKQMPDQVWAEKFNAAQVERHGRLLLKMEIADQLRDPNSMISKLARERWKVAA